MCGTTILGLYNLAIPRAFRRAVPTKATVLFAQEMRVADPSSVVADLWDHEKKVQESSLRLANVRTKAPPTRTSTLYKVWNRRRGRYVSAPARIHKGIAPMIRGEFLDRCPNPYFYPIRPYDGVLSFDPGCFVGFICR
jgi:hypothetical protein